MRISRDLLWIFATLLFSATLPAADPGWLPRLQSPDMATRRSAMDEIQTRNDPRIVAACLPLLRDDGDSIRRLAARAIGSRFDQIPRPQTSEYLAALRQCAARGPEDVTLMCRRAVGLLTREYSSEAFSTSPDGKWVLYERRRWPVIANVAQQKHTLLEPSASTDVFFTNENFVRGGNILTGEPGKNTGQLKLMITNAPVAELFDPQWQPQSLGLAFQPVIQARFFRPVCIWRASDGEVRVWTVPSFAALLRGRFPHWGTTMDFVRWEGPRAVLRIYDCDDAGEGPYDPRGMLVSVDLRDWKTALAP